MTHNIKILEDFATAVVNGEKTFEIRENDRGYQKGDIIQFTAVDSIGVKILTHPINDKKYIITYVLSGWGLKDNVVVFSIAPIVDDYDNGFTECERLIHKIISQNKTDFWKNIEDSLKVETI